MHSYFSRTGIYKPLISDVPSKELGISIVIPSYNEENLEKSLLSLLNCYKPKCNVEILVVVNHPQDSNDKTTDNSKRCIRLVEDFTQKYNTDALKFFPIQAFELPKKHAGVGLARKIGMDEAAWRMLNSNSPCKIIACFDADAACSKNYLEEIEKLWLHYPDTEACSIRYEHPIEGDEFPERIYNGIAQYELHLRYYVLAGKYVGHPFSYHTVGSSMACSIGAYMRYGGMNKQKAGEDFYFLQKIIPHGKFREINTCCIYPSPRPSYRVPFGTGRAMTKFMEKTEEQYLTYNLDSWLTLKPFLNGVAELYMAKNNVVEEYLLKQHQCLQEFLRNYEIQKNIEEINANTSSPESFRKRFFQWFDAFLLLKYLNFANETHFVKQPILGEAQKLADLIGIETDINLLHSFRNWEYKTNNE